MKYTESQLRKLASPISQTEEEKCKNAIRMVRDALKKLNYTDDDKNALKIYAQKYRPGLNYNPDADVCEVANDEQLKDLIYCILQRYYTTEIGGKMRVAHSVDDM